MKRTIQQFFYITLFAIIGLIAMPTPAVSYSNLPYDYNPRYPGFGFGTEVIFLSGSIILGGVAGAVVASYKRGKRGKTGYEGTDGLNGVNGTNGGTGATGTGATGSTGTGFTATSFSSMNVAVALTSGPSGPSGYNITTFQAALYGPDGTLLAGPVAMPGTLTANPGPNYQGAYHLVFTIVASTVLTPGDLTDLVSQIQTNVASPATTFLVAVPQEIITAGITPNEIAVPIEIYP